MIKQTQKPITQPLEFNFPVEPIAVQSARFFRYGKGVRSYQPEKVTNFKQLLRIYALQQLPENFEIFTQPLKLEAEFVFLPPKSMRKRDLQKIQDGGIVYKPSRPDLTDNLLKGCCDALTKTVWSDDALICEVHSIKRYGTKPFIRLVVSPLF